MARVPPPEKLLPAPNGGKVCMIIKPPVYMQCTGTKLRIFAECENHVPDCGSAPRLYKNYTSSHQATSNFRSMLVLPSQEHSA